METGVTETSRESRIQEIAESVIERRSNGELLTDEQVSQQYPELLPELTEWLGKLRVIHRGSTRAAKLKELETELSLPFSQKDAFPGYELLRQLGKGGQGRVYLAKLISTGQLVAIKTLLDPSGENAARMQRFNQEVAILGGLRHRNLVPLLDSGTTPTGERFLVTPYIEGHDANPADLAESLRDEQRLALFITVCRAVQVAHSAGIVHRDLKPANIRIDAAGEPHVLDFGLASVVNPKEAFRSMTTTGDFVGTMMWSSPEQFTGVDHVTTASDVYSLGVILHQLLCAGQFPQQSFNNLQQVGTSRPLPRKKVRLQLDTPLAQACKRVLLRALDTIPENRFADAGSLADAVETAIARAGVRSRIRKVALVSGIIAGIAGITFAAYRIGKTSAQKEQVAITNGREELRNWVGDFVYCPPGTFSSYWDIASRPRILMPDEKVRGYTIARGFYISTSEIRQGTFETLMGSNPSQFKGADLPVDSVTYDEAIEFCSRAGKKLGCTVRLPSEWEWEYACRAGAKTTFNFGDDAKLMIRYGNFADRSVTNRPTTDLMPYDDGYPHTSIAGMFHSNLWHIRDMHGNLWEWCAKPYQLDPTDASSVVEGFAPMRGGSWYDKAIPASERNAVKTGERVSTVGFRVVIDDSKTDK